MVRVRYAPLVDEARGKLGNIILSRYKQTDKAYIHRRARNPNTPAQARARERFRLAQRVFSIIDQNDYPTGFFGEPSNVTLGLGIGWLSWKVAASNGVSQTPANQWVKNWIDNPKPSGGLDNTFSPFWTSQEGDSVEWDITLSKSTRTVTVTPAAKPLPAGRRGLGYVCIALAEEIRLENDDSFNRTNKDVGSGAALIGATSLSFDVPKTGTYFIYTALVTNLSPWPYDFSTLRWHDVDFKQYIV